VESIVDEEVEGVSVEEEYSVVFNVVVDVVDLVTSGGHGLNFGVDLIDCRVVGAEESDELSVLDGISEVIIVELCETSKVLSKLNDVEVNSLNVDGSLIVVDSVIVDDSTEIGIVEDSIEKEVDVVLSESASVE
jgi:hypothetical protein